MSGPSSSPPFSSATDGPLPALNDVPERFASAPEFTDPAASGLGVPPKTARGQPLGVWVWLALIAGLTGLVLTMLLWQKLTSIQEELARRSIDAGAVANEARTLARQAEEVSRELAARLTLQEARVNEVSLQRTQLEELMQSLSRSRDDNLVVDLDASLRLAQQQAQFTGSGEALLAALKSADQRLQRAAQPRLAPVQRAIARDMQRIQAVSLTDVPTLLARLDDLIRLTDELLVVNSMLAPGAARVTVPAQAAQAAQAASTPRAPATPSSAEAAAGDNALSRFFERIDPARWAERTFEALRNEARQLLRVSRIDQPEAALLSPEQSFFLRENLKLRLLNARLSLLSRQTETARSDLVAANAWLTKYFDPASRKTQTAAQVLGQVQSQLKSSELTRLDDTLTTLSTAAAGR
jgi:uroporphyrin-III C-methyltransferase